MNNPTLCEVLIDGEKCGGYSSYVFKSAHTTRLVCDQCANRYRGSSVHAPILEFSLLELIPAREILLAKVAKAERLAAKAKASSALWDNRVALGYSAAGALGIILGGASLVAYIWLWWAPAAGLLVFPFASMAARYIIDSRWLPPRVAKLHQEFPET